MMKSKKIISLFVSAAMLITMLASFTTVAYADKVNNLLSETFDELNTDIWGYSYMNASTREMYTESTAKLENNAFYMKTNKAESTSSYVGGFYGKFNKNVPIVSSYTDDESYVDIGKNTKIVTTFKLDTTNLNTTRSKRLIYFGFHNSSKLNNATDSKLTSAPYGIKGHIGGLYTYLDGAGDANTLDTKCFDSPTKEYFVKGDAFTKGVAYYKIELCITDENGAFLERPWFTLSYRTSESDPWTDSAPRDFSSDSAAKLGYIDCLYFSMTGSSSSLLLDDVNAYVTYDSEAENYSTSCDEQKAYFYAPEASDCFAAVAAYGPNNTLKDVIKKYSLISGENEVSLEGLDTDGADYIKVFLWKDDSNMEPLCNSVTYELE